MKEYSEQDFLKEFPPKIMNCIICKKAFYSSFNNPLCSDKCFLEQCRTTRAELRKYKQNYFKTHYVRSTRNKITQPMKNPARWEKKK